MSDDRQIPGANPQDPNDRVDPISVILPVFNECQNLAPLVEEITDALGTIPHEIVAVDDGSEDASLEVLRNLTVRFPRMRIVALPHRSGQSAALIAGFEASRGAIIVTLDADGQNDPRDIPQLLELMGEPHDGLAVVGIRSNRAANPWKRIQGRIANSVRDLITGDRVRDTGCALRVARRGDLRSLPRFKGMHRFIPTLLRREGVTVLEVPVNDRPRLHGTSKYGMWDRVFVGFMDAWGVRWLIRRAFRVDRGSADQS